MFKKILSAALIASVIFATAPVCFAANEARYIYVSPDGKDGAEGTAENPLKTIYGAIDKISLMPKTSDIHVVFGGGEYEFDKTARFEREAAGTETGRIYYEAAEGENVVFSGARKIDTSTFKTVTDEDILRRLPQRARGKVLSLNLKEQGIDSLENIKFNNVPNDVRGEYYSLYLNGKKEMMAQWPNGENNFVAATDVLSKFCFRFAESNPMRWKEADQLYIAGFMDQDYWFGRATVEKIDFEEQTIQVKDDATLSATSTCAKRWKAFNLLEEIDIPGEWFIDVNTYMLYYYPHEGFNSDDLLEMSFFNKSMLEFSDSEVDFYTTFKGITFTQNRETVISGGGRNITMTDCTLSYIDGDAVTLSGICNTFEGNRFIHIAGFAFEVMNYGKLYKDNEKYIIRNNYLTKCATAITSTLSSMTASTHGLVIENNVFHNMYGGAAALGWETCEAKVRYNEVYNCEREMSDCGVFYCGNNTGDPRNEFAYNLIYDYKAKSKHLPGAVAMGIYMDDLYCGAYIHHNILDGGNYGGIQIGGGQNNIVENNVIMNMGQGPIFTDNRGETWQSAKDAHARYAQQAANGMARGDFAKKYPWLADAINYTRLPIHNVFRYNISNQTININERMEELGTVKNNVKVDNMNDFVDAEHYDYRIKKGSKLDKLSPDGLNEENFSMDMIGVSKEVMSGILESYKKFGKTYPANEEKNIRPEDFMLTWDDAVSADEYRVVIANDPELKDVVADFIAPYTFCDAEQYIEKGEKTYYWKVTAINKSINHSSEWDCADGISSFTTTKYDTIDEEKFNLAIEGMEHLINAVSPETYYESAINEAEKALEETKSYMRLSEEKITLGGIKNVLENLENAKQKLKKSRIVIENIWDDNMFKSDAWELPEGVEVSEENGEISFKYEQERAHISPKEEPTENMLQTFDIKLEFDPNVNTWFGFEAQRTDLSKDIWSDNGYLIVVKKEQSELQKYINMGNIMSGGIIDTIVDDVFTDGEFHKVSIGVIEEVGSVRFIFKVDDTPYYEYTDYSPFKEKGRFDFRLPAGVKVTLKKHEETEKSDTGTWHDSLYLRETPSVLNGIWNEDRTTSNESAYASTELTMGEGMYAIFCEKAEIENPDDTAKYLLDVDYVWGREGDERTYEGTVDFSNTDSKWAYIGMYENVMNGAKITVKSSGGKNIYGGKIRVVRLENGYEELAAIIGNDESAAVFKADSITAFAGQNKKKLSEAPQIRNGMFMLPLRTVCESFGMTVVWNDAKQCAEVTLKDDTVVEFAESDGSYAENGSLMISAGIFAEKIGKKAELTDGNVMIFAKNVQNVKTSLSGLFN